ncbi:MAG TPA: pyridoxamine 5'-phosphate oxidase family protein, partial [Candidatus Kurthia intestinigallinarum]|nr:pyridoxamine 5'-phosphate oxidase family protein [Candidatus Kurthia intestinigallinarum]
KEFWNPIYEKMFDVAYDDPQLVLIKVHAESAEYWETGSTVKSVYNFVKKVVGKEEPVKPSKDTNQSLDL